MRIYHLCQNEMNNNQSVNSPTNKQISCRQDSLYLTLPGKFLDKFLDKFLELLHTFLEFHELLINTV